jgi:hypothetical protein
VEGVGDERQATNQGIQKAQGEGQDGSPLEENVEPSHADALAPEEKNINEGTPRKQLQCKLHLLALRAIFAVCSFRRKFKQLSS